MSPPGSALPGGGPRPAAGVPGSGVLGQARAVIRRSGCPSPGCRAGTRGARCQPDGPDVHGRQVRRLPVPGPAPRRVRLPDQQCFPQRRHDAPRCVDYRAGALRSAGQQAVARGVAELPAVLAPGTGPADQRPGCGGAGPHCHRIVAGHPTRAEYGSGVFSARVRAQRAACGPFAGADLQLSPEPAEHLDRPADPADAGRGVPACRRPYPIRTSSRCTAPVTQARVFETNMLISERMPNSGK